MGVRLAAAGALLCLLPAFAESCADAIRSIVGCDSLTQDFGFSVSAMVPLHSCYRLVLPSLSRSAGTLSMYRRTCSARRRFAVLHNSLGRPECRITVGPTSSAVTLAPPTWRRSRSVLTVVRGYVLSMSCCATRPRGPVVASTSAMSGPRRVATVRLGIFTWARETCSLPTPLTTCTHRARPSR
eukprot:SAG11_NODE_4106_length_2062_cov_4.083036_1_plen_184_part_00